MSGGSRPATIEWNFVIADGQTTRQDLDLRAPTTCSVHGHLTVQGSPAVGWSIGTTRVGSGVFGGVQPNGDTDFAGNFTLEVDDPAEYEFSIHSVGADASSLTIEEHSVLHRGENTWSRDLQTASVQGKLHGANTRRLWYRSGEGASFKARADFTVDATGTFSLAVVPTGPGEIVEWVSGAKELAVLAQFTAHLGLVEQVEVR